MFFLARAFRGPILSGSVARIARASCQLAWLAATALASTSLLAAPFAYLPRWHMDDVAIIDTATHTLVKYLPVADSPRAIGLSPDGAFAYIGHADAQLISVISGVTLQVVATIEVDGRPQGLAVSPDSKTLWVALKHDKLSLLAIDTVTRQVVATYSGELDAYGIVVSPDGAYVYYVSTTNSRLSMVDTKTLKLKAKAVVQKSPSAVTITPSGHQVWVTSIHTDGAAIFDTVNILSQVIVFFGPSFPAASLAGGSVWIGNRQNDTMSIIDTATKQVIKTFKTDMLPAATSFTPNGKFAYVANSGAANVQVFNAFDQKLVTTISNIGGNPLNRFILEGSPKGPIFIEMVAPLKNEPAFNTMSAGNAVDLRFSLGGDHGPRVLAQDSLSTEAMVCPSAIPAGTADLPRSTSSIPGLRYDAASGDYVYTWLTDRGWARSCRRLTLALADGTRQQFLMQFR